MATRWKIRLRFSLWAMLVLITVVAIPLGFVAQRRSSNLRRKAAYEELIANGISLECHYSRVFPSQRFLDRAWLWLSLDDVIPPVTEATDQPFSPTIKIEAPAVRKPECLALMKFFPEIELIELNGWEELMDEHLRFLERMPELTSFTLTSSPRVRGDFLKAFESTGRLEGLTLQNLDSLEGKQLQVLEKLTSLEGLSLAGCALLNDITLFDANLPLRVDSLQLEGDFGDQTITRWLGQCRLKYLTLDCPITKMTTAALPSQTMLVSLDIRNAPLVDDDFIGLKHCERLDYLKLQSMPIRGKLLEWLPHPERLSVVSLANTLFSDEYLAVLARFEELYEVDLTCTPINGEGFSAIQGRLKYTRFNLWGTRLTRPGKEAFAKAIHIDNQGSIWLPSNWRSADMPLLAHAPSTPSASYISVLATYEPNWSARGGDTYLADEMLQPSVDTPHDRCPAELMGPVIRLQQAAERDGDWYRRRINGAEEEMPPGYLEDPKEGVDGK